MQPRDIIQNFRSYRSPYFSQSYTPASQLQAFSSILRHNARFSCFMLYSKLCRHNAQNPNDDGIQNATVKITGCLKCFQSMRFPVPSLLWLLKRPVNQTCVKIVRNQKLCCKVYNRNILNGPLRVQVYNMDYNGRLCNEILTLNVHFTKPKYEKEMLFFFIGEKTRAGRLLILRSCITDKSACLLLMFLISFALSSAIRISKTRDP